MSVRLTKKSLVRALTRPYAGAHLVHKNKKIKVWRAKELPCALKNCEYGKVLKVRKNQISVKCYDGAILLTEHEFSRLPKTGEYLT